jgi:hypothetical protein
LSIDLFGSLTYSNNQQWSLTTDRQNRTWCVHVTQPDRTGILIRI